MKKIAPLALALAASLAACAPAGVESADDDVGEAREAITSTGTWSGLAAALSTTSTVTCSYTSSSLTTSVALSITPGTTSITFGAAQFSLGTTVGCSASSLNGQSLSSGQSGTVHCNGFFATVGVGSDKYGNLTLEVANVVGGPQQFTCNAAVATPTAFASNVAVSGSAVTGATLTGSYTFTDTDGLVEHGSTYQWYRVASGASTAISGATSATYTATSSDVGSALELCVTPADTNGSGAQVCSSATSSVVHGATASNVVISGNPYVSSTLTGTYAFSDLGGLAESGSTYQWYTVSGSTLTPISGATSLTYVPTSSQIDDELGFCVTPADSTGSGATVCSSSVTVAGVVWYSGVSQTGTGTGEATTDGACVNMSTLSLGYTPQSLVLYGQASGLTYIYMYTGSGCSGTAYVRSAGAGGAHNINLGTVGIGSNLVSYKVSW